MMKTVLSSANTGTAGKRPMMLIFAISVLALAGCAHRASSPALPWHDAAQAVVVVTADWNANHGTLHT